MREFLFRFKIIKQLAFINRLNIYMDSRATGMLAQERIGKYNFGYTAICMLKNIPNFHRWNNEAKQIRDSYDSLDIYNDFSARIGETIRSFMSYLYEDKNPQHYKLFVSRIYQSENKIVLEIINRTIPVIMEGSYAYWIFICCRNIDMINNCLYISREQTPVDILISSYNAHDFFKLNNNEVKLAESKISYIDTSKPYICILNRDGAYLNHTDSRHKYRNFDISDFSVMAEKFSNIGIPLVRVGQKSEKNVCFENCIDFCNDYYDELVDVYLVGHCKFWIGASNGANMLARVQDIPNVMINCINFTGSGCACIPSRDDDMYILKKYYYKKENRYLSLIEMCIVDLKVCFDNNVFDILGIEPISNTPEEIYDVAVEMNSRIDGTWTETEEDAMLQKKFWDILNSFWNISGYKCGEVAKGRIGSKFLKENLYLLECKDF